MMGLFCGKFGQTDTHRQPCSLNQIPGDVTELIYCIVAWFLLIYKISCINL